MTENEPYMTYALWGSGDITPENAKALLEEYVPDNVGTVYRPERITRDEKGLRVALDWFESPDFLGDGGAVPSTDLIQSLTFDRDTQGDDVFLLALWPAVPSHEDFDFIELVQNNGILVIDLGRAWDELDLSLYSRPDPTKEEKAEAKAEAKKGAPRARRKPVEPAAEPEPAGETQEEFTSPTVEEAATTEVVQTEALDAKGLPELQEVVPDAAVPTALAISNAQVTYTTAAMELMESIDRYVDAKIAWSVEQKVAEALAGLGVTPAVNAEAEQDMTRPPFEPPYVGIDTKPYFWNKNSKTYRPAVGGPKRGEQLVNMTEQEAAEKGAL